MQISSIAVQGTKLYPGLWPSTSDILDWLLRMQLLSKGVVKGSEDRGGHPEPHRTATLETNTNRAGNSVVTEATSLSLQLLKVNKKVNAYSTKGKETEGMCKRSK